MKTYTLEVCGLKRELPLVPIDDQTAFASFVIISDTELIEAAARQLTEMILETDQPEVLVTAEAKGIALAYEVSRQLGMKNFVVARKSVKSYMKNVVEHEVHSITTKGVQKLYLDGQDADQIRDKKVCLLDDVISTGESLKAIEDLVVKAGGKPICRTAVLAEGDAADRKDILFLKKLPLFRKNESGEYEPIN